MHMGFRDAYNKLIDELLDMKKEVNMENLLSVLENEILPFHQEEMVKSPEAVVTQIEGKNITHYELQCAAFIFIMTLKGKIAAIKENPSDKTIH